MMKLRDVTIRHKLIAMIMVPIAVIMVLAITVFVVWEQIDSHRYLIQNTLSHVEMLADNCKASLAFDDKEDAEQVLSSLRFQDSVVFACVYTKDGGILTQYESEGVAEMIQVPKPQEDGHAFENGYFSAFKQVVLNDEIIGTVYLRDDMRRVHSELKWDIVVAVIILLVAIAVGYFLSSKLQIMISRPILYLAQVAKDISEKRDYSVRALQESNDEIGYLTQVFNTMLEQIQQHESALTNARDQLETRVRERTAELTNTNQQLTREVTERVKAEEQVRHQNEFLNTVIDSLTHPFYVINVDDYTVKMANSAAQQGCRENLCGKVTCHKLTHARDEPCSTNEHPCPIEEIKRTGKPVVVEHIHYDEDRNPKNIEVHAYPIFDNEGKLSEVIEYSFDITDRKQAEEALRTSEAQLSNAIKIANLGYWEYDVADDQFTFNDRFYDVFHTTAKQVGGYTMKPARYAELFLHPDDRQVVAIEMKKALETTDSQYHRQLEHRIVYATGEIGYISVRFVIVKDKQGRTIKTFGANQDITDRKRTEKEKTHEKLLETSRMAGMAEVAADVLHNVGNVLNSINVSTTLVTEKVANSELANLEKLASLINDHIEDLGTFLTEHPQGKHIPVYLTEVSKCLTDEQADIVSRLRVLAENVGHVKEIISTQQSYAKVSGIEVRASLAKLVEDAIQINSAGLQRHGTQLIRELDELPDVEIDKQKVLQILVNLISNAKYALSGNGKEEKLLTIRLYKNGEDCFRIEVADNGIGISKDNLTKIFSHGFTTKQHGHGFGLHSGAIAAKEMGGSLTVHSNGVGQGATFTLELPFKPVEVMQ